MPRKARVDVIRGIQAVGYLTEIDTTHLLNLPKLTIESNLINSMAFGLGSGTGLILELRMLADRPTHIAEFGEFELAGEAWGVDWWAEEESPVYKFYTGLDFPRDVVLNHRVGKQGLVKPGIPMEGLLLGRCQHSVPIDLRPFDLAARLSIVDGFQTCHRGELSMRFDTEFGVALRRRASSLFEPADSIYERPSRGGADLENNEPRARNLPSPEGRAQRHAE
jgi:hypothetical protein